MSKVLKEFGTMISVNYPTAVLPQDIIDSQVMPALRRSYDRARRENWRMAKETTSKFDVKVGPVKKVWGQGAYHHVHYYGWYVAVEIEEETDAVR
jgi:hypothetical protein